MSVNMTIHPAADSSLKRYSRFYRQLIGEVSNFTEFGNRAVKLAEQARAFRQYDMMKEAARVLTIIPMKHFQTIGHYFLGLYQYKTGVDAQRIFEQVAENASTKYRALALQSLAATYHHKQDYASELHWLIESSKLHSSIGTLRGIAVVKANEGYHRQALRDLENLLPLSKYAEPILYYDYLNSLAVELGKAGRLEEARSICKVVLASPFAFAYSEWQETAEDVRGANRSFVAMGLPPSTAPNVLFMPAPKHSTGERSADLKQANRPARVFNLQLWKTKMVKKPKSNNTDKHSADGISDREMLLKIVELASTDDLPHEALCEMVEALEKIVNAHKQKET